MSKLLVYLGSTLSAITLSTVMIGNVCADQTGNFTDYLGYAKGVAGTALNDQHGFNPGDTFKSYNSHPSQAGYYGGGKQETTNLGQDAVNALPGNEADSAVSQDFLSRPVYEVNQKDPDIKNAKFIQNNSYDISRGVSDQYVDCTKKSFCHNTYTQASCTRAKQFDLACHQVLKVTTYKPPVPKNCQHIVVTTGNNPAPAGSKNISNFTIGFLWYAVAYHVYLAPGGNKAQGCYVDGSFHVEHDRIYHGTTNFMGAHDAQYFAHAEAFYKNNHGYADLSVQAGGKAVAHINSNSNQPEHSVELDPKSNTVYTLNGYNRGFDDGDYGDAWSIYWASTPSDPKPTIHTKWIDDCSTMEPWIHSGICGQTKNVCTDGPSTKTIGNVPVTEPCWAREQDYSCGVKDDGSCDALKEKGCSQLSSQCINNTQGQCLQYHETWQCPQKTCTGYGVQCGANFYCMDGKCNPPDPSQMNQKDFNKAVAGMAEVNSAAEDVKSQQQNIAIFTGQALQCRKDVVGFSNCCNNSGWGHDIKLGHCDDEEKKLGKAREDQRTYSLGTKCIKKILGACIQHAEVFCMFDSRLAADAQIQGRVGQLGISMGSGDSPNCRGMSVDELQRLDFSKMDLSNIYSGIDNNVDFPNAGKTKDDINQRIKDFYNKGKQAPGGNR